MIFEDCRKFLILKEENLKNSTFQEKQQGHARNSRQRQVAMFIKEAQSVGLSARKAQNLDFEKIARMSLLEVALQKDGEKVEEVRFSLYFSNIVKV